MTEQVYYMLLRVPGGRMLHHKEIAARGPSFTYRVDNLEQRGSQLRRPPRSRPRPYNSKNAGCAASPCCTSPRRSYPDSALNVGITLLIDQGDCVPG